MAFNIDALLASGSARSKIAGGGQAEQLDAPTAPPQLPAAPIVDPFLANYANFAAAAAATGGIAGAIPGPMAAPMAIFNPTSMMKSPSLAELQMLLGMGGTFTGRFARVTP